MQETSTLWLRVAAVLYSAGLIYVLHYVLRRSQVLYRPALGAFVVGAVLHFVSIAEASMAAGRLAVLNFQQGVSLLGLFLALVFLVLVRLYDFPGLSLLAYPITFFLALIGTTAEPFGAWPGGEQVRGAWLVLHVILVLGGFVATLFMALASLFYLVQERHLKLKQPVKLFQKLPPLRTLDVLASRAMVAGFILTTAGTITGGVWAYAESGTQWIGEGKIHISLFTWAFYLAVVYLRTAAGWRGRRAAFLAFYVLLFSALTWVSHAGLRPLIER
jgi:ABC-type uncharacterized transport system permease subunit